VIRGVELVANQRGYNVIVGLSNESFSKEVINIQMLANGSIDGFILSISKETLQLQDYHHFNETMSQGMPIVMFDRVVNEINCDKVIIDDFQGAKVAVEKLINNGAENIAIITTRDYVSVGKLRTQGYIEALKENSIELKSELILKLDDLKNYEEDLEALEKEIKPLFETNKNIDAVFGVNELYALTAMKVARSVGLSIPDDIQVIGFTDGVLSKNSVPSMTTVSQHGQQMGERAAHLLIDRLENEEDEEHYQTIIIPTDLVERNSTK
ncbi:MAG: substrate-binding domain-containing protein, partial [Bacteroidota bacterium]